MKNYLILFLMAASMSVAEPVSMPSGNIPDQLFTTADVAHMDAVQPQDTFYLNLDDTLLCYYPKNDPAYDVCATKTFTSLLPPTLPGGFDNHQPGSVPSSIPEPQYAYLIVLPSVIARPKDRDALRRALRKAAQALRKLPRDRAAQDLIEWALLAGLVAVAAGAVLPSVATSISTVFSQINSTLVSAGTVAGQ